MPVAADSKSGIGRLGLVLLLVCVVVVTGCVTSQGVGQDSEQPSDVIVLLEFGEVFLVSPKGGNARPVPHEGTIHFVRTSNNAKKLLVKVGRSLYEELALDGTVIGTYKDLPQGHGFTVNANDEPLAGQDAYAPGGKKRAFWRKKTQEANSTWLLTVEQFADGATQYSEHVLVTRVLKKYGFVGGIQWSPDGEWIAWAEPNDRWWGLQGPFMRHFKIRTDGTGLEEIKIYRPLGRQLLREVWPPEPHGYATDFQWVRF